MQTRELRSIIQAWNLLNNGQGGLEFNGILPIAEYLGITDISGLLDGLEIIKGHKVKR